MDWAAMIMNMYQSWAQRRGYTVTVIEEMPGELAGIKVYLFLITQFGQRQLYLFREIITDVQLSDVDIFLTIC